MILALCFIELDLPEVIALRREFIPEQPDDCYIAASLLETGWMDELRDVHRDCNFIFVAEGVLMYFPVVKVRWFLHNIAMRFGGGELWFDVCGTMMSKRGVKPDSMKRQQARILSGIDDGHEVERWEPALRLIDQANYMKFFRHRWGIFSLVKSLAGYHGYAIVSVHCSAIKYNNENKKYAPAFVLLF